MSALSGVASVEGLLQCWMQESARALIVYASGEVDLSTAPELKRHILGALKQQTPLILDFSRLTYLDGSGIRVLEECTPTKGTLQMILPRQIRRLFHLLGLEDRFLITDANGHDTAPRGQDN